MCLTFESHNMYKPHKTLIFAVAERPYVEMMGLIGAGNNPMVGMTVAVAVEEAMNK